ncbi:MAG: Ig-like domain repeat protein [Actinocatenispora sp.]
MRDFATSPFSAVRGRVRTARHGRRGLVGVLLAVALATTAVVAPMAPAAAAPPGRGLAWGLNAQGQLGNGGNTSSNVPVTPSLPAGVTITAIVGGGSHSLALTSTGSVLAWGDNSDGQLGNGTNADSNVPVTTSLPAGTTITALAAGRLHSLAATSTGSVLAWGDNAFGQLGNGSTTDTNTPVAATVPAGTTVTAVSAGSNHSLALTSTGSALAWGDNTFGQLGNGTNTDSSVPIAVSLPAGTTATQISAGGYYGMVLTSVGAVLSWGSNTFGQLGVGSHTDSNSPAPVTLPGGTTITAVDAGNYHALALTSTGTVLAWGNNFFGQLGDGTFTESTVPVSVTLAVGTTVTAVSAGGDHSLAIIDVTSTTTLTSSPAHPQFGKTVTLAAAVTCTAGTPTGTVTFLQGSTALGTATLAGGPTATASLTVNGLPAGSHTLHAHYNGAGACPASDSAAITVVVECTTISGSHVGGLSITQATCFAPGTTYTGTVTLTGNGALDATGATINSLNAAGGSGIRLCGSTVGSTTVNALAGVAILGDPTDPVQNCAGNTLTSSVSVISSTGFVEISTNHVTLSVLVNGNTTTLPVPAENATATEIESNVISGGLTCTGNTPAPTNAGHPNTVTGPRSGQCAAL